MAVLMKGRVAAVFFVITFIYGDVTWGNNGAAAFDFSPYPECNFTESSPSVPKLTTQFTIKVEGKQEDIKGNLDLFDSDGYYDAEGQRGATFVHNKGDKSTFLYDFITGRAYDIEGNMTCSLTDLYVSGCNAYAIFIAELAGHSNVSERCNFTAGPINYLGEQGMNNTVRAIPVRKWQQCVYDGRQNVVSISYYYFNKEGLLTPSGRKDVPIRFENKILNGTNLNSTSTYDFTYYADSVEDNSVFLPASGSFCPNWTRENRSIPALADQFTLTMMTVAHQAKEVHSIRMNFDYKKQLVSFVTDGLNGTHFPPVGIRNKTLYRTVHDYSSGLAFVTPFDAWLTGNKKCNVTPIDNSTIDSRAFDSSSVHLRNAYQFFGMNRSGWIYIGEREFNEVPSYTWSYHESRDDHYYLTEVYFLKEEWTSNNMSAFAGMILYDRNATGGEVETYRTVVSDYNTYAIPWRQFDVDSCLRTGHSNVITFTVRVKNYTEVAARVNAFEAGLRDALSSLLNTSALRFTDIRVMKSDPPNEPQILLTVLEWTNATGRVDTPVQKKSQAVVDDLKSRMADKDYNLTVWYGGKNQTVTFLRNSLRPGADLVKTSTAAPPAPATSAAPPPAPPAPLILNGYTGGSMAGLAIAMILIGGVAGLVAGFLLWKRNTGIAYQVYD